MKRLLPVLTVLYFILPPVSFAAGLTSQQANSLIAVVQSSPSTPASIFVPLITSFSNITVNQAVSLITVVQTAPGVPASAFVNLLISFTDDTSVAQPTVPAVTPAPTPTPTTEPIVPQSTSIVPNTQTPPPAPVVQQAAIKELTMEVGGGPVLYDITVIYKEDGERIASVPVTLTGPLDGYFVTTNYENRKIGTITKKTEGSGIAHRYIQAEFSYRIVGDSNSDVAKAEKTFTAAANGLTKTATFMPVADGFGLKPIIVK